MADIFSEEKRSRIMSGIRNANTRPELLVRSLLHRAGYRFRLQAKELPGRPDIWLPKHRVAVFVHGCFWHLHECHLFKWPSSNTEFWRTKLTRNREVDRRNLEALMDSHIRVLLVWECALKGKTRLRPDELSRRLVDWMKSEEAIGTIEGSGQ